MDKHERRSLGVHYTSEANILRVLEPLLLDDLRAELEAANGSPLELERFAAKLARIHVFDPACGCGNFLIVAYRELRRIENALGQSRIRLDQFIGIEIDEDAAAIARAELGSAKILTGNALAIDWSELF